MNIQIITSSYPSYPGDPTASAGLFVNAFVLELQRLGHRVIVHPVARKSQYQSEEGVIIEPLPWKSGDVVLAEMSYWNPSTLLKFIYFFREGRKLCIATHQRYAIDRTLCMWAIPCGLFGYWIKRALHKPYDVWVLGSDIWRIRNIPLLGPWLIKRVINNADHIFADGLKLCDDVKEIAQRECPFLPSTRVLPKPITPLSSLKENNKFRLLFVGRYHQNKGPDLLIESMNYLSPKLRAVIEVHLFGFGNMMEALESLIKQHALEDVVKLHHGIEPQDLSNYLNSVHYLIIPSRIESVPVIFFDAMQIGTPVISTPVGDLPRLINQYNCGIIAQSSGAKEIAAAIEEAFQSDQAKLREGARKLMQEFDMKQIVTTWLKVAPTR